MVKRQGANAAIRGSRELEPKRLGCVLWTEEKLTVESEGTSALEDRSWVQSCRRACGQRDGRGGANPKDKVSGRRAGVLKRPTGERPEGKGWGQQPGAWAGGRVQGSGRRES